MTTLLLEESNVAPKRTLSITTRTTSNTTAEPKLIDVPDTVPTIACPLPPVSPSGSHKQLLLYY